MATAKMKGSTFPRYEQNRFFPFPVSKESSLVASWARASVALGRTLGSEREEKKQIAWSRIVFVLEGEIYFSTKKRTKAFLLEEGCAPFFHFFPSCSLCVLLLAKEGLCFVFKQTTHLLRFCFIIHKTTQNTGYHRSTTSTVSRPYRTSNNRTSFSTTGRRTRITCSSTRWRNSRVRCPCPSTRTR
jgi:hypothetical protein